MGAFIAKQPNGLYCRFSSVVDCPTDWNMTEEDVLERYAEDAREHAKRVLEHHIHPFDDVKEYFAPRNMTEEEFEDFLRDASSEPKVDIDENASSVYAVRVFDLRNGFLSIYGIYTDLEKATTDITTNERDLEFDEDRWVWRDPHTGHFYRIDEYTLHITLITYFTNLRLRTII